MQALDPFGELTLTADQKLFTTQAFLSAALPAGSPLEAEVLTPKSHRHLGLAA